MVAALPRCAFPWDTFKKISNFKTSIKEIVLVVKEEN